MLKNNNRLNSLNPKSVRFPSILAPLTSRSEK